MLGGMKQWVVTNLEVSLDMRVEVRTPLIIPIYLSHSHEEAASSPPPTAPKSEQVLAGRDPVLKKPGRSIMAAVTYQLALQFH